MKVSGIRYAIEAIGESARILRHKSVRVAAELGMADGGKAMAQVAVAQIHNGAACALTEA